MATTRGGGTLVCPPEPCEVCVRFGSHVLCRSSVVSGVVRCVCRGSHARPRETATAPGGGCARAYHMHLTLSRTITQYSVIARATFARLPFLATCSDDSKPYMILEGLDESYKNHVGFAIIRARDEEWQAPTSQPCPCDCVEFCA